MTSAVDMTWHVYDICCRYNISCVSAVDVTRHVYDMSVLYTNRAVCRHKSGDCQGCVEDCTAALQLTPQSPKPLLRRAVAYEALER